MTVGMKTVCVTLSTRHHGYICRYLSPTPRSMKYYQFLETRAIFHSFLHICILPSLTNDGSVNVWQRKEGKGRKSRAKQFYFRGPIPSWVPSTIVTDTDNTQLWLGLVPPPPTSLCQPSVHWEQTRCSNASPQFVGDNEARTQKGLGRGQN